MIGLLHLQPAAADTLNRIPLQATGLESAIRPHIPSRRGVLLRKSPTIHLIHMLGQHADDITTLGTLLVTYMNRLIWPIVNSVACATRCTAGAGPRPEDVSSPALSQSGICMIRLNKEDLALDPLFHAHARVFIRDIQTLEVVQGLERGPFGLKGRPINSAQIMGTVISLTTKRYRGDDVYRKDQDYVEFILDDGTGLLPCLYWPKQTTDDEAGGRLRTMVDLGLQTHVTTKALVLGACVLVVGNLQVLKTQERGDLWRLEATGMREADGPDEELLHWLEVIRFHKQELDQPHKPILPNLAGGRCGCRLWKAIGYCCCRPRGDSPETALKQPVLEWLVQRQEQSDTNWTASYRDIRGDPCLQSVVKGALPTMGRKPPNHDVKLDAEMTRLFRTVLQALQCDGVIELSKDGSQVRLLCLLPEQDAVVSVNADAPIT